MKNYIALIIPLLFSLNVQGEVIGSFSDYVGGSGPGLHSEVDVDLTFWRGVSPQEYVTRLFDDLIIDETDEGASFYANDSSGLPFQAAADLLTNGVNDWIGVEATFGAGVGLQTSEANAFFDGNGIDFNGYAIDQIELKVDSIEIELDTLANKTTVTLYFTVNVYDPSVTDISIEVIGGIEQECKSPEGKVVTFFSYIDPPDQFYDYYFAWTVDDEDYGTNTNRISPVLSNGEHTITVVGTEIMTEETVTDTVVVEVTDTQPPNVFAAFVDAKTGQEITQASSRDNVYPVVEVTDKCDPEPTVAAIVGVSADNGGVFSFDKSRKALSLKSTSDEEDAVLSVIATDNEGNVATENVELRILQ